MNIFDSWLTHLFHITVSNVDLKIWRFDFEDKKTDTESLRKIIQSILPSYFSKWSIYNIFNFLISITEKVLQWNLSKTDTP